MMKKRNLKTVCIIIGIIAVIVITFCTFVLLTESFQRFVKDITSDYNGGIERTIFVYDYNGELIRKYKGNLMSSTKMMVQLNLTIIVNELQYLNVMRKILK